MKPPPNPTVGLSVIIPHLRGERILSRCLASLAADPWYPRQVIVVDNGSTDGSVPAATSDLSWVTVVRSPHNLGFAGGCNLGLSQAEHPFALILNDDAEVAPGCLRSLMVYACAHLDYAALQPKILSSEHDSLFDYAGAAGGFLDLYGYPFARGRVFSTLEADHGQYDDDCDVLWASGACCLLNLEAVTAVGSFDETFFAHMEEIDLCWRLWLAGYRIGFVADAVAFHRGAATLSNDAPQKTMLNHRNGLWMMVKNLSLKSLLSVLPLRILLDWVAAIFHLARLRPRHALAVVGAHFGALAGWRDLLAARRRVQQDRRLTDDELGHVICRRSVVLQSLIQGRRRFSELVGLARISHQPPAANHDTPHPDMLFSSCPSEHTGSMPTAVKTSKSHLGTTPRGPRDEDR